MIRLFARLFVAVALIYGAGQAFNVRAGTIALLGAGTGAPGATVTFDLSFTTTKTDSGGGTTVTYNSGGDPSIGTADTNRIVAIAVMARIGSPSTVSSATIGGVSATQVSGAACSASLLGTDIWYAAVPTGTTATIAVTYGSSTVVSGIGVYRIVTGTTTPTDGQTATSATVSNSTPLSKSVTVPASGGMVGSFGFIPGLASLTMSWSGGTVTRDATLELTGSRYFSPAHDTGTFGSTTYTVTPSGGNNIGCLSLAAWH